MNLFSRVVDYWVEFGLGVLATAFGVSYKKLKKKFEIREIEYMALKEGLLAILHDRLFQLCSHYLELGYIPVSESEKILDNANVIYEAYHNLGGNGTGTDIYEKFKSLKVH